jgi:hypothetical protein
VFNRNVCALRLTDPRICRDILNEFKSSPKRITGVLVIDEKRTSEVTGLSPDKTCPNDGFGLYADDTTYGHCGQQEWNSAGESTLKHNDGLMFNDWPFPIFMVRNATNIEEIKDVSIECHTQLCNSMPVVIRYRRPEVHSTND